MSKFNARLLQQVKPWLQVFFEGKLTVTSAQHRMATTVQASMSNAMIIEEGGSYEEAMIANPAMLKLGLSLVQLSLNKLAELQVVRTRVREDTPGVIQYHAGDMVSFIKNHIKIQNNQMILIFTDGDLFPRDGWSFGIENRIFNLASYSIRDDRGKIKSLFDKYCET